MTLGENIRSIRNEKGLSILELKEKTGLSKSTISELENDKSSPTAATLEKIANALKVPVSDFFADENESIVKATASKYFASENEQYKKDLSENEIEFNTPQAAIKFILEQPAIMGFGGFDINKMSDEEVMSFANELLNQLKLLGYKYKK